MVDRKTNVANRFTADSTAVMTATALDISVLTTSGSPPSPAIMIIEPGVAARAEVVLFNGVFTGTKFATTSLSNRYLAGSAAGSGIEHPVGSKVVCVPLAQHIIDLNDRIDSRVAKAGDTMTGALTVQGATVAKASRSSYTGNGASSRTIALPFTPGFVVVTNRTSGASHYSGVGDQTNTYGIMSRSPAGSTGITAQNATQARPRCATNGFIVASGTDGTNVNGDVYDYLAVG